MPLTSSKFIGAGLPSRSQYDALPITPSDAVDVPVGPAGTNGPCIGVQVTGAGNVNVDLIGGGPAVLTGLAAGQVVDCGIKRIRATSTTATGIFALYDLSV